MKRKLLGLCLLLVWGSFVHADQNIRKTIPSYKVDSYQQAVDMKSYVGKWESECVFNKLQQDYTIESFEFEHPFVLKKTIQVFKNHICTIPRLGNTNSYQINHILKKDDNNYILYSSLKEPINLSISKEDTERMLIRLDGITYGLTKVYK